MAWPIQPIVRPFKPGRRLQTNVEFYTALLLLHGLELEVPLFHARRRWPSAASADGSRTRWSSAAPTASSARNPNTKAPAGSQMGGDAGSF